MLRKLKKIREEYEDKYREWLHASAQIIPIFLLLTVFLVISALIMLTLAGYVLGNPFEFIPLR